MKNSGYDDKLKYQNCEQKHKTNPKHIRKRNIIWYNPLFSYSVKKTLAENL